MQAIAPNLTAMVGELVGARLIAHAGIVSLPPFSPLSLPSPKRAILHDET